jgi:hypothetical protein
MDSAVSKQRATEGSTLRDNMEEQPTTSLGCGGCVLLSCSYGGGIVYRPCILIMPGEHERMIIAKYEYLCNGTC